MEWSGVSGVEWSGVDWRRSVVVCRGGVSWNGVDWRRSVVVCRGVEWYSLNSRLQSASAHGLYRTGQC